ncbi:MAG: hypothetical protein Q8Q33_04010 [Chlamydiota bacterium]|nr:hypothetical protein [Chlamydiota bacterium]
MLELLLSPLLLMFSLWLVARHDSELAYVNLFFVNIGIFLCVGILNYFLFPIVGRYVWLMDIRIIVTVLVKFCYVSIIQAILAVIVLLFLELFLMGLFKILFVV